MEHSEFNKHLFNNNEAKNLVNFIDSMGSDIYNATGKKIDIIEYTKLLGIDVYQMDPQNEFPFNCLAFTSIDQKQKVIAISSSISDPEAKIFILAYQMTEYLLKGNDECYHSIFKLDDLDLDVYQVAKNLYLKRKDPNIKIKKTKI